MQTPRSHGPRARQVPARSPGHGIPNGIINGLINGLINRVFDGVFDAPVLAAARDRGYGCAVGGFEGLCGEVEEGEAGE